MIAQLKEQPVRVKLLVLLVIAFISLFLFNAIGFLLIPFIFGINISEAVSIIDDPAGNSAVNALKFLQLINAFAVFILPPVVFGLLFTSNLFSYFKLNRLGPFILYLIVPAIMISALPLINYLAELNKGLQLPEALKGIEDWMKAAEESTERTIKIFLKVDDIYGLMFNLLLIALIPAFGEELLFRGSVQQLFREGLRNRHVAVWLAAVVFSALHFQFYGFLPRVLMGALLGYMFLWGNSLWLPILAHLVNNGLAVTAAYLVHKGVAPADIEHLGEGEGSKGAVILSAVSVIVLLFIFYFFSSRKQEENLPHKEA